MPAGWRLLPLLVAAAGAVTSYVADGASDGEAPSSAAPALLTDAKMEGRHGPAPTQLLRGEAAERLVPKTAPPTDAPLRSRSAYREAGVPDPEDGALGREFPETTVPKHFLYLAIVVGILCMALLYYRLYTVHVDAHGLRKYTMTDSEDALKLDSKQDSHFVQWQSYFRIAFWLLLLLVQASFTRIWCQYGIPHDCETHIDVVGFVQCQHRLLGYGFILAVFAGVPQAGRFGYLFSFELDRSDPDKDNWVYPRGIAFLVIFFLSDPFFGSLDLVPFLTRFSLTAGGSSGTINTILLVLLSGGSVGLFVWHFWYAWSMDVKHGEDYKGFAAYAVSRSFFWMFYVGYFYGALEASAISFHMHHYIVGFLFAILAEFNHPLSLVLLAASSGIMVQGIAAYGADAITTGGSQQEF